MTKPAFLRGRVTEDLKVKFEVKAKSLSISPSALVRVLATQATQGIEVDSVPSGEERPRKEGQVWFRLTKEEHARLRGLSAAFGMKYNQYAALLVRAKLSGASLPTDAELRALEEANYELMALGRNLNQIAHALNLKLKLHGSIDKSDYESVRTGLLRDLLDKVTRQQDKIEDLLDAMQRRGQ